MINKKDISIIKYTSLIECISEFYIQYTCNNLKKRTLEYFKKHNIDYEQTTQKEWKKATDYVMELRNQGVLSKYFETVQEQIYNTTPEEELA